MERKASCTCGQLQIIAKGAPAIVLACNCFKCQQRTGSVFGVSAYYKNDVIVEKKGDSQGFDRAGDSGKRISYQFCPHCGSTVF